MRCLSGCGCPSACDACQPQSIRTHHRYLLKLHAEVEVMEPHNLAAKQPRRTLSRACTHTCRYLLKLRAEVEVMQQLGVSLNAVHLHEVYEGVPGGFALAAALPANRLELAARLVFGTLCWEAAAAAAAAAGLPAHAAAHESQKVPAGCALTPTANTHTPSLPRYPLQMTRTCTWSWSSVRGESTRLHRSWFTSLQLAARRSPLAACSSPLAACTCSCLPGVVSVPLNPCT